MSLCPAAGLSRGRLGSGPAADGLRLGEAPTSAPCPLGPSPRLCARGAWPHGRALSQKNEGIEGKCLPGNGGAGRIQLLKFLVWEEQSPQLASNWPMWLQPPPPLGPLSGIRLRSPRWFSQWPSWSWGRPPRPLTPSREGASAPRAGQVHVFSLGSSGPRA